MQYRFSITLDFFVLWRYDIYIVQILSAYREGAMIPAPAVTCKIGNTVPAAGSVTRFSAVERETICNGHYVDCELHA